MVLKRILLAEDSDDDLALALRAIKKCGEGISVCVARDGEDCVSLLMQMMEVDSVPDLVLLDLKMPKMGGLEVLQRICEWGAMARVPVVVLSSSDEPTDVSVAYELGANSYTVKPVDFDDFMNQICQTVEYWTRVNVPARTASPVR
jgi:two-component system, response regulator